MKLNFRSLKALHRSLRETLPEDTSLRAHRTLSWLRAAEEAESFDAKFIFLWIAFNSVYGQEIEPSVAFNEKGLFREFLDRLIRLDQGDLLYEIAWENYSGKIRLFINNPYVSRHFWSHHAGLVNKTEWKRRFDRNLKDANRALATKDTVVFTCILFDRLYTLRNQLIHGAATYKGKVNRSQVRDGARILEQFVPAMIFVLLENPTAEWGVPCFPPVSKETA